MKMAETMRGGGFNYPSDKIQVSQRKWSAEVVARHFQWSPCTAPKSFKATDLIEILIQCIVLMHSGQNVLIPRMIKANLINKFPFAFPHCV